MSKPMYPFVGSEALLAGFVSKYDLRTRYRAVFPDVYVHADAELTPADRARCGWLWSHREGVLAGLSAASLHGAKWVETSDPVEVIWPNARPPRGLHTFDYRLAPDEMIERRGMRLTSLGRTAFDLGRRGSLGDAVARLDALGNANGFRVEDVVEIARRHKGARGLRQLATALDLHDPGAESPKETWLRLLLIDEGFPRPQTQLPVPGPDGQPKYRLDMGWEELMVAVEYDGEHHRTDRTSWRKDIVRLEYVHSVGWNVVRVVAGDRRADIVRRVQHARQSRLL